MVSSNSEPLVFAGRLRAEFRCVAPILDDLCNWLSQQGCPPEFQGNVEIVMAEALNNVIEHGGLMPHEPVEILARIQASGIHITIIDKGLPYPDEVLPENNSPEVHDLPEGGFGWMLIHTLTQGLTYRRGAETNILTLYFERQ